MGKHHNPRIVTDGLVLCLDAANKRSYPGSGTTWFDLSGNGNDGNLVGTYAVDVKGGFTFSTNSTWVTGGYSDVPHSLSIANITTFTLSFGIFSFGTQSHNGASVFHKANESNTGFICEPINNNIRINYGNGSSWFWSAFTTPLNHNTFFIYDMVYNGSQLKIYRNGTEISFHNATIAWDNTNVIRIGRRRGHLSHYLYGTIFFERFYNRALTPQEVQQNFNALRGRYGI
jgi:hypothetical protein